MKEFSATTTFHVKNEATFNKFMKERVAHWITILTEHNNTEASPVDLALGEAAGKGLIQAVTIIDYYPVDYNRMLAGFRANKAPEAFRAMFAEV